MTKINCLVDHRGAPCTCDLSMYENLNKPMTKNSETHTDWDKRFDKRFPLEGGIWVLERHRNEVRNFIAKELADARKEVKNDYDNRMFTIDSLKRTCKHCGVIRGVKLHEDTDSHDRYQIGYNKAIDDVLATLREEETNGATS